MTGCCVSWKCLVACLPVEESQQPTWPHDWHSRRATQTVLWARHSSHAPGVLCTGKPSGISPSKCSHDFAICPPISNCNYALMNVGAVLIIFVSHSCSNLQRELRGIVRSIAYVESSCTASSRAGWSQQLKFVSCVFPAPPSPIMGANRKDTPRVTSLALAPERPCP